MRPHELISAAQEIQQRWPGALIFPPGKPSPSADPRLYPPREAELAVDVQAVWPHKCDGDDEYHDCAGCGPGGVYRLVAWISGMGEVHYVDTDWIDEQ